MQTFDATKIRGSSAGQSDRAGRRSGRASIWVAGLSLFLGARLWRLVSRYSVNLVWWDQWDFYIPLFEKKSLWEIFMRQHTTVRQGMGLVLDKFVLDATHWSNRAEALFIVATIFAAMLLALYLKARLLGGGLTFSDATIPFIFLTPAQYEIFLGAANPSFVALPLLLVVLYCIAWIQNKRVVRYVLILMLNFLSIYTGFGLFIGLITLLLMLVEVYRTWRTRESGAMVYPAIGFLIAALSLGSFFFRYVFTPAADCFRFPDQHPLSYFRFTGLMFANFVALKGIGLVPTVAGIVFFVLLVAIIVRRIRLFSSPNPAARNLNLVITILLAYSVIYAVVAAIGRLCLGLQTAQASRYITLLIPAFFGVYLQIRSFPKKAIQAPLLLLFLLMMITGSAKGASYEMEWFRKGKQDWKECYLKNENIQFCDQATGFKIYPVPEATRLKEKLDFLKRNKLNLYADAN